MCRVGAPDATRRCVIIGWKVKVIELNSRRVLGVFVRGMFRLGVTRLSCVALVMTPVFDEDGCLWQHAAARR